MSPKELLYIEDALSHLKFMKDKCDADANALTDAHLVQLVERIGKKSQMVFDDVYSVLASHANGGA